MMERVQIQGGSNGVYVDSKGRHLRTMGDFAPSPGQWVYTNGVTIYGHQTAAQQPFVFTNADEPILPLCIDGAGLFDADVKDIGQLQHIDNTSNIRGYAGNKKVAYAKINDSWVNLCTGEKLGKFDIFDAAISDNNKLISGELGNYSFSDGESNSDIEYYTKPFIHNNCTDNGYGRYLPTWGGCILEQWDHYTNKVKNETMKIRENGRIITEFDLAPLCEKIKAEALIESQKINESGNNSGRQFPFYFFYKGTYTHSQTHSSGKYWNWEYIKDFTETASMERKRPNPFVKSVNGSWEWVKVDKKGNYYGVVTITACGESYPWFSRKVTYSSKYYYGWGYFDDREDKTELFKDWLIVDNCIRVSFFINNGVVKRISENRNLSLVTDGAFLGERIDGSHEETPQRIRLLNGYDLYAVKIKTYANYGHYTFDGVFTQCFYILGMGYYSSFTMIDHSYNRIRISPCSQHWYKMEYPDKEYALTALIISSWEKLKGASSAEIGKPYNNGPLNACVLNSIYNIKINFADGTPKNISLYAANKKISVFNSEIIKYWYRWKCTSTKNGVYILSYPDGPIALLESGKVKSITDEKKQKNLNTFTMDKFIGKKKLRRILKRASNE